MSIPELERIIDGLRQELVGWTIVVAAGLVIEYVKPISTFLAGLINWLRRAGARPSLSATVIGGILITVGVTMEGWVEFRSSRVETKLAAANDAELTAARLEIARLYAAMADRDLSLDQQSKLREACEPFRGKAIDITSYPGDHEAERLIVELQAALNPPLRVQARVGQFSPLVDNPNTVFGIRILPAKEDLVFGEVLAKALRDEGRLFVEPINLTDAVLERTQLAVGWKPPVRLSKK